MKAQKGMTAEEARKRGVELDPSIPDAAVFNEVPEFDKKQHIVKNFGPWNFLVQRPPLKEPVKDDHVNETMQCPNKKCENPDKLTDEGISKLGSTRYHHIICQGCGFEWYVEASNVF